MTSSSFINRESPTILLVEDEPFVREATCKILENVGFKVITADNAITALVTYETTCHPIDLVITDMVLPGETGEQLALDLRQRSPEVKVLITSGYANAKLETENCGMNTYFLAKPYSRRSLTEKINSILAHDSLRVPTAQAG